MCTTVRFDPSFDSNRTLLNDLLLNIVKKQVPSTFVDSSKDYLSFCTSNKKKLGFMKLTDLPKEAVVRFSRHAQS